MLKNLPLIPRAILFILILLTSHSVHAFPEQALVPGGIALLQLPDYKPDTEVFFEDKRVAVFPHKNTWLAMAGIGLSTKPGDYEFSIRQSNGVSLRRNCQFDATTPLCYTAREV